MRLEGKVALITGGASGLGQATALLFASEGARVVVADLNDENAAQTVEKIAEAGGEATGVSGDVSVNEDAEKMVGHAVESYGRLDVVVNSAGVNSRNAAPPGASDEELWDRIIDVNLKGTYLISYHAVPEMKKASGGSIVNLASIIGLVGYPIGIPGIGGGFNPYASSKGGVVNFTRNLAVDVAKDGIRVNCLCPGFIETDLTRTFINQPEVHTALVDRHPMGRLGRPEEVANATLYLASDESAYVTGTALPVDGGYTAQ